MSKPTPRDGGKAIAKVLVHAPNWVGDHAMAFPFYAALHDILPGAKFVLLGRSWITDLAPASASEIIAFSGKNIARQDFLRLRSEGFDLAFTLSPSFRSAWLLKNLQVKTRYGFASDWRSFLLSRPRNRFRRQPYNRHEHRALAYLRLLAPLLPAGQLPEDLWERYRDVKLRPLAIAQIEKKYDLLPGKRRIVICPGSTAASKKYPVGHFISTIELLQQQEPNLQFILLGARIDAAECGDIAAHFSGRKPVVFNLCGETTLSEAHALIASSRVAVANDSGLAHITSLTDTALVTFNGMGRSEETSPLTRQKIYLDLKLDCSPCFARECPRKDYPLACLNGIAPAMVARAVLQFL